MADDHTGTVYFGVTRHTSKIYILKEEEKREK